MTPEAGSGQGTTVRIALDHLELRPLHRVQVDWLHRVPIVATQLPPLPPPAIKA